MLIFSILVNAFYFHKYSIHIPTNPKPEIVDILWQLALMPAFFKKKISLINPFP